jgi:hypothetical protein
MLRGKHLIIFHKPANKLVARGVIGGAVVASCCTASGAFRIGLPVRPAPFPPAPFASGRDTPYLYMSPRGPDVAPRRPIPLTGQLDAHGRHTARPAVVARRHQARRR